MELLKSAQVKATAAKDAEDFFAPTLGAAAAARAKMFAAAIADACTVNPALLQCSPESIKTGLQFLFSLDLPPSRGLVYLYPQGGQMVVSLTHRALILLAERHGYRLSAHLLHKGDTFSADYTSHGVEYRHQRGDAPRTWDNVTGGYVAVWRDGDTLPRELAEVDRSYFDAARGASKGGVWGKWPAEMALKSLIKAAFARGYVSIYDLSAALVADTDADLGTPAAPTAPTARTLEDALTPPAP